jgi:predicted nucleotidyltransferase component of viral defense system
MEQIIQSILSSKNTREENVHALREFLQILVLKTLYETRAFQTMAFVGGTALRILYGIQRFSEDLDFSVTQKKGHSFPGLIDRVRFQLEKTGLALEFKIHAQKTVQRAFVQFPGILERYGVSDMKGEKLSIRIEVDSNPPAGWKAETTVVNRVFIFPVRHFGLSSLFATKLHVCLFRRYAKGRDFYDLMWYLSRKVEPNLPLLHRAIRQTEHQDWKKSGIDWRHALIEKIKKTDFKRIRDDVGPFLVHHREAELLKRETFIKLIQPSGD